MSSLALEDKNLCIEQNWPDNLANTEQAYGETLRPQIQDHIERFWDGITQGSGQDPKAFIHLWLSETDFIPAIEHWTPTLLEEVRGIGEGAALDFETILSWQFLDELGWYINYIFLPRLQGSSLSMTSSAWHAAVFRCICPEG